LGRQMLLALLLVVYVGAIGVAVGVLLVAIEAFEPNRRLAWVLKLLIIGAAAAAVMNRLLDFVA
jgi:fatty-acid desaturase